MASAPPADVSLDWRSEEPQEDTPQVPLERPTQAQMEEIARVAGTTLAAIYGRLKRGDTGDRLWRPKSPQGRKGLDRRVTDAPPIKANAPPQPKAHPAWRMPLGIEDKAEALGIPLQTVLARVEAGWPPARLLDPVKRWSGRRRTVRA